jgi:hypothetical protein
VPLSAGGSKHGSEDKPMPWADRESQMHACSEISRDTRLPLLVALSRTLLERALFSTSFATACVGGPMHATNLEGPCQPAGIISTQITKWKTNSSEERAAPWTKS